MYIHAGETEATQFSAFFGPRKFAEEPKEDSGEKNRRGMKDPPLYSCSKHALLDIAPRSGNIFSRSILGMGTAKLRRGEKEDAGKLEKAIHYVHSYIYVLYIVVTCM